MRTAVIGPFPPYRGGIAQFSGKLLSALRDRSPGDVTCAVSYSRLYPSLLFPGRSQFEPGAADTSGGDGADRLIDSASPFRWAGTKRKLEECAFDRMIIQWWHPFFAPSLLRSLPGGTGIRRAAVCHNVFPHEPFPFGRALSRSLLSRMDLLVVHSESDMELAESISTDVPVLRLYHPLYDQYLDASVVRAEVRRAFGYTDSDKVVLFFGLIRPYKGLSDLISACSLLPPDVKLLIAGESYMDKGEIKREIDTAGLGNRVMWRDSFIPDSEVASFFEAADVVALPYRSATQSGVAQIALSFSRPLVLTRTGGLADLVDEGTTGALAEPGDVSDIARAVMEALELSDNDSTRGAVHAKSLEFGWDVYADSLMEALG